MRLPDGWLFTPRQDTKDRTKIVIEKTEIVRCANCQYWAPCDEDFRYDSRYGECSKLIRTTDYDWFCADGEAGTFEDD